MTLDHNTNMILARQALVHEFARTYLAGAGYTWSGDVQRLAELVQECCEDYVADMTEGERR